MMNTMQTHMRQMDNLMGNFFNDNMFGAFPGHQPGFPPNNMIQNPTGSNNLLKN